MTYYLVGRRSLGQPQRLRRFEMKRDLNIIGSLRVHSKSVPVKTSAPRKADNRHSDVESSPKGTVANDPPRVVNSTDITAATPTPRGGKEGRSFRGLRDVNGALDLPIEHFRAITKVPSTPSAPAEILKQVPPLPDPPEAGQEQSVDQVPQQQRSGPASNVVKIKQSPHPSPIDVPYVTGIGFCSVQNMNFTSEASKAAATTNDMEMGRPKVNLVNPATRGRSLKMTVVASNNAITHSSMAMPPPALPSRVASRPVAPLSVTRSNAPEESKHLGSEGVPLTGPWSREAFDLFGNWRPPGRATCAASTAG